MRNAQFERGMRRKLKKNAEKRETQPLSEVNDRLYFSIKNCGRRSVRVLVTNTEILSPAENGAPSNCVWSSRVHRVVVYLCRYPVCNWLTVVGVANRRHRFTSIFRFDVCLWFLIFAFVLKCHSMALLFQFIYPHFCTRYILFIY